MEAHLPLCHTSGLPEQPLPTAAHAAFAAGSAYGSGITSSLHSLGSVAASTRGDSWDRWPEVFAHCGISYHVWVKCLMEAVPVFLPEGIRQRPKQLSTHTTEEQTWLLLSSLSGDTPGQDCRRTPLVRSQATAVCVTLSSRAGTTLVLCVGFPIGWPGRGILSKDLPHSVFYFLLWKPPHWFMKYTKPCTVLPSAQTFKNLYANWGVLIAWLIISLHIESMKIQAQLYDQNSKNKFTEEWHLKMFPWLSDVSASKGIAYTITFLPNAFNLLLLGSSVIA